jgi:hypothetical protein
MSGLWHCHHIDGIVAAVEMVFCEIVWLEALLRHSNVIPMWEEMI